MAGLSLHGAQEGKHGLPSVPQTARLRWGPAMRLHPKGGCHGQDVLAVVGVAHMPGLRGLHLGVAAEPEGSSARPIVVGCRGPHPDLSQLAWLGMAPSINLCVNFLRYLSSLPGLTLSEGLQRAVDAYLGRRQSLMFVLMFGHHEDEQARPRLACFARPVAASCSPCADAVTGKPTDAWVLAARLLGGRAHDSVRGRGGERRQ